MRTKHKVFVWRGLLSGLLLIMLLASPKAAQACSCAVPPTAPIAVSQVNAVFVGEVVSVVDQQTLLSPLIDEVRYWLGVPYYSALNPSYGNLVTFNVQTSWKGITTTTAEVRTGYGGGDCGYLFSVGAQYVVYARGATDELRTGICGRTDAVTSTRGQEDLRYLNSLPALPLTPAPSGLSLWLGVAVLVIVLVVIAVTSLVIILHRRKPKLVVNKESR